MLAAQLEVQLVLEVLKGGIWRAGDGDGTRLVLHGVDLDVVLERVVVDVI